MWPFTTAPSEKQKRTIRRRDAAIVKVNFEVATDGKIMDGTAYFSDEPRTAVRAAVPIDALGELVLKHHERLGFDYIDQLVCPLPIEKNAKRGHLYLTVTEGSDNCWVAMIGGLNLIPPPCTCPHNSVDWHTSRAWENRNRAVGMLILKMQVTFIDNIRVQYDHRYNLGLRHHDDPDWSGDCCCCDRC